MHASGAQRMKSHRIRQPALLAPLPRPAVARRRAQQRHRTARRRARSRRCARAASSCSPRAPGPSANKLKFFRLAFGAAGGFADEVDTREARAAIEGLFGGDGRIQLGWMVDEPTMSKAALKVLLNLALIAGDALVRGGRLDVGAERHDGGARHRRPRRRAADRARSRASRDASPAGIRRGRGRAARRRAPGSPMPGRGRRRRDPARRPATRHADDRASACRPDAAADRANARVNSLAP